MIRFIDEHKNNRSGTLRWGIESIANTLGIAPSTYHAAKTRPPSPRAIRDSELRPQILRVWEENLAVNRCQRGIGGIVRRRSAKLDRSLPHRQSGHPTQFPGGTTERTPPDRR